MVIDNGVAVGIAIENLKTKTERRADKQSTKYHFRVTKFHYIVSRHQS